MGIFGRKTDKQAKARDERRMDAELALEALDNGWDGWVSAEPRTPEPSSVAEPLPDSVSDRRRAGA